MNRKVKIVYVGNKLAKHGQTPTGADTLPPKLEAMGIAVVVASDKRNKMYRLFDMLRTVSKHNKEADAVLIDTYSTSNFYYAVLVARLCRFYKIPYLPILRGGNLPERLQKSPKLAKRLFGHARVNVALSRYMQSHFETAGYPRVQLIPNALELDKYPYFERENPTYKLLWVRSFAALYHPEMALEVVRILQSKGKTVRLCMVGPDKDGSLERCKEMAQRDNLPVEFTGILSKAAWVKRAAEFDVFINTTNFDNMPVSVMEAMALGLPVVSTDVGGMPFFIKNNENGILVPPNQPEAFAEAIITLVEDPDHYTIINKSARETVTQMDWETVKNSWDSLLKSISF